MITKFTYSTHNQLSFKGKKVHPTFAKIINDAMYEASGLDGFYSLFQEDDGTLFCVLPEDPNFGDDPSEHKRMFDMYVECYHYMIEHYPQCLI